MKKAFIPIKIEKLRFYLEKLLVDAGDEATGNLKEYAARVAKGNPHIIESSNIHFWYVVKTAIEYIVDFQSFDATPETYDVKVLEDAYHDLTVVIDYVELVFGVLWEPEIMGSPW